jgi:hypothetical protein
MGGAAQRIMNMARGKRLYARPMLRPALLWLGIGGLVGAVWALPQLAPIIPERGYLLWLLRALLASYVPGLILVLALAIVMDSGGDLAQRPPLFLLALVVGATVGTLAIWTVDLWIHFPRQVSISQALLSWWVTIMVFGGVFGWAGVLHIRRIEDQAKLASLLAQRSVLALRVAHSNLLAARAKIDPEMVARVLRTVRDRYRSDADKASQLLDHLIAYLRLAMNRERESKPSWTGEISLLRAYVDLREAEAGMQIGIGANVGSGSWERNAHVLPIFPIAKAMLDAAMAEISKGIALQVDVGIGRPALALETGASALSDAAIEAVRAELRRLPHGGAGLDILHQSLQDGVHRYVVKTDE